MLLLFPIRPEKKNTCVSGDPRKKNRVGRSEKVFFFFFFFKFHVKSRFSIKVLFPTQLY